MLIKIEGREIELTDPPKIVKGTVTIEGQIYTAFEMWGRGPWKVVKGTKFSDPPLRRLIMVKSGKKAIEAWLEEIVIQ